MAHKCKTHKSDRKNFHRNTKVNSDTQNLILIHKIQSQYTKLNSDTQNSIPIHKTQSQYTKLNSDTQNSIPIHKTQFRYTKLNLNTQNSKLSRSHNTVVFKTICVSPNFQYQEMTSFAWKAWSQCSTFMALKRNTNFPQQQ